MGDGSGGDGSGGDGPSVAARDDLAGVVDLFEWLTREELSRALSELAFKQRAEVDDEAIAAAIDVAVAEYALVPAPPAALSEAGTGRAPEAVADSDDFADGADADGTRDDAVALAVGPAAFPSLPADAEDLPHILDVPERDVDRELLSEVAVALHHLIVEIVESHRSPVRRRKNTAFGSLAQSWVPQTEQTASASSLLTPQRGHSRSSTASS